jgi:hypothetical protein
LLIAKKFDLWPLFSESCLKWQAGQKIKNYFIDVAFDKASLMFPTR